MKLKTLKDLRKGNLKVPYILMEAKIKAESIKWVKEDSSECPLDRNAFMNFHNITEEDVE